MQPEPCSTDPLAAVGSRIVGLLALGRGLAPFSAKGLPEVMAPLRRFMGPLVRVYFDHLFGEALFPRDKGGALDLEVLSDGSLRHPPVRPKPGLCVCACVCVCVCVCVTGGGTS